MPKSVESLSQAFSPQPSKANAAVIKRPASFKDEIRQAPEAQKLLAYTPSKPSLENPEWHLIQHINRLDLVGNKFLKLHLDDLEKSHDKLEKLTIERAEKLREAALKAEESDGWDILKRIAQTVLAAMSTILGMTIIASGAGTLIGGALIASGISAIVNVLLTETGVWEWVAKKLAQGNEERAKQLAAIIPAVVGLISGACGLLGSAYAATLTTVNGIQLALTVANAASNIASGIVTIGKGVIDSQQLWIQADLTRIKKDSFLIETDITENMSLFQRIMKELAEGHKSVANIIAMAIASSKRTNFLA
ncbi:MAG: hypothetical protein ACM3JI_04200 [Anaerolineae bacterium]